MNLALGLETCWPGLANGADQSLQVVSGLSVLPVRVSTRWSPVPRQVAVPQSATNLASLTVDTYVPSVTVCLPILYSLPRLLDVANRSVVLPMIVEVWSSGD